MMSGSPNHGPEKPIKWNIAAAFFRGDSPIWLDDFIHDDSLSFKKVHPIKPNTDWHHKPGSKTSLGMWRDHFAQARQAFKGSPDGIITCFPQLAICCAAIKKSRLFLGPKPYLIAYNFNLGDISDGWRRKLAMLVSDQIDKFIVHSPSEVEFYARYLGVAVEKVGFIPLQRGVPKVTRKEDRQAPFLLSMGSAGRDYETLVTVVQELDIPTVIVTRADIAETLPKSSSIKYMSGLSQQECMELLSKCRLSVTPIKNLKSASGQVTFINSMRLGVPTIATACPGTDGYVDHGKTGILVAPFDTEVLREAIQSLWSDSILRKRLGKAGRKKAEECFSDEHIAKQLRYVLQEVSLPDGTHRRVGEDNE